MYGTQNRVEREFDDADNVEQYGERSGPLMFEMSKLDIPAGTVTLVIRRDLLEAAVVALRNVMQGDGSPKAVKGCRSLASRLRLALALLHGRISGSDLNRDNRPYSTLATVFVDGDPFVSQRSLYE